MDSSSLWSGCESGEPLAALFTDHSWRATLRAEVNSSNRYCSQPGLKRRRCLETPALALKQTQPSLISLFSRKCAATVKDKATGRSAWRFPPCSRRCCWKSREPYWICDASAEDSTAALLLRADVQSVLQMGESGSEKRKEKYAVWTRGPSA